MFFLYKMPFSSKKDYEQYDLLKHLNLTPADKINIIKYPDPFNISDFIKKSDEQKIFVNSYQNYENNIYFLLTNQKLKQIPHDLIHNIDHNKITLMIMKNIYNQWGDQKLYQFTYNFILTNKNIKINDKEFLKYKIKNNLLNTDKINVKNIKIITDKDLIQSQTYIFQIDNKSRIFNEYIRYNESEYIQIEEKQRKYFLQILLESSEYLSTFNSIDVINSIYLFLNKKGLKI